MAAPLDRTWYNTLVDDDGSGNVGTVWNKVAVDALLDSVDAALSGVVATSVLAGYVPMPVPGHLPFATDASIGRTTAVGADTGQLAISGGGLPASVTRGGVLTVYGNQHAFSGHVFVHLGRGTGMPAFSVARGTDFATLLSVQQDGIIQIPQGQLLFPSAANPSTSPYVFDDYREGQAWTPGLTGASGGTGQSYPFRIGSYAKMAGMGFYFFQLNWGGGTLSGSVRLTGFPTTSQANASTALIVGNVTNVASNVVCVSGVMIPGANYVDLHVYLTTGGGSTPMQQSHIPVGFSIIGAIMIPHHPPAP